MMKQPTLLILQERKRKKRKQKRKKVNQNLKTLPKWENKKNLMEETNLKKKVKINNKKLTE